VETLAVKLAKAGRHETEANVTGSIVEERLGEVSNRQANWDGHGLISHLRGKNAMRRIRFGPPKFGWLLLCCIFPVLVLTCAPVKQKTSTCLLCAFKKILGYFNIN